MSKERSWINISLKSAGYCLRSCVQAKTFSGLKLKKKVLEWPILKEISNSRRLFRWVNYVFDCICAHLSKYGGSVTS